MNDCDLCHQPTRNYKRTSLPGRSGPTPATYLLCGECRAFAEMYANFTPEDWDREYQMIAAYEVDHEGDLL